MSTATDRELALWEAMEADLPNASRGFKVRKDTVKADRLLAMYGGYVPSEAVTISAECSQCHIVGPINRDCDNCGNREIR
jgi:hypothetical protein